MITRKIKRNVIIICILSIILLSVFTFLFATSTIWRLELSGFEKYTTEDSDVYYQKNDGNIILDLDDKYFKEIREVVYPADNFKYTITTKYTLDENELIMIEIKDSDGNRTTCQIETTNPDYQFPDFGCLIVQEKKEFFKAEALKVKKTFKKHIPWYVREGELKK